MNCWIWRRRRRVAEHWWRVELDSAGKVVSATVCPGAGITEGRVVYVCAITQTQAGRIARNTYAREVKRAQRAKYKATGKCRCGRDRESIAFKQCMVCRARDLQQHRKGPSCGSRDEKARVVSMQATQRDRRQELRLETLLLVREAWSREPNQAAFSAWLAREVMAAIAKTPSQEMTEERMENHVLNIARAIEERRTMRRGYRA
jgi:hypothetical protein